MFACGLEYHWLLPWGKLHVLLKLNATLLPLLHIFQLSWYTLAFAQNLNDIEFNNSSANWICWDFPTKSTYCKHCQNQPIDLAHPTYLLFHTPWMYKIIFFLDTLFHFFFMVLITLRSYCSIICPEIISLDVHFFVLFNFELASLYHSCSNRGWGSTSWFDLSWLSLEVFSLPVLSAWKD